MALPSREVDLVVYDERGQPEFQEFPARSGWRRLGLFSRFVYAVKIVAYLTGLSHTIRTALGAPP